MRSLPFGRLFSFYLVFIILLGVCAPLRAQTTSTEILGLVTDASGAVVPGAKVTITRLATGETRTAQANAAGEYSFPLIEIGDCNVRVEMQGFKSQTVTGLHVETQRKARVNLSLEVGQVRESIELVLGRAQWHQLLDPQRHRSRRPSGWRDSGHPHPHADYSVWVEALFLVFDDTLAARNHVGNSESRA